VVGGGGGGGGGGRSCVMRCVGLIIVVVAMIIIVTGVMVVWTFSTFLSSLADEFRCLHWCYRRYMDRFVDKHYIVLRDIAALPTQLSDALRQWFEVVSREH
jgi:midasin (ATPase involved in ribosome maturation)